MLISLHFFAAALQQQSTFPLSLRKLYWPRNEDKRKWTNNYSELAKRTVEHEGDKDITFSWCVWDIPQKLGKNLRKCKSEEESKPFRRQLSRWVIILRRVLESWEHFLSIRILRKTTNQPWREIFITVWYVFTQSQQEKDVIENQFLSGFWQLWI